MAATNDPSTRTTACGLGDELLGTLKHSFILFDMTKGVVKHSGGLLEGGGQGLMYTVEILQVAVANAISVATWQAIDDTLGQLSYLA